MTDKEQYGKLKDLVLGPVGRVNGSRLPTTLPGMRRKVELLPPEGRFQSEAAPFSMREGLCPHLGTSEDPGLRYMFPSVGHRCYVNTQVAGIPREHQSAFCFSEEYKACSRFVVPASASIDFDSTIIETPERTVVPYSRPWWRIPWPVVAGILLGVLAVSAAIFFGQDLLRQRFSTSNLSGVAAVETATAESSATTPATAVAVASPTEPASTATTSIQAVEPTVTDAPPTATVTTPTIEPTTIQSSNPISNSLALAADSDSVDVNRTTIEIVALESDIGWIVSSDQEGVNHFGDPYLYSGIDQDQVYHGVFQFDLSNIPTGVLVDQAVIQMTGLRDDRLGDDGTWTLHMLVPDIDEDWQGREYQEIMDAPTLQTFTPILQRQDMQAGQTHIFDLSPEQIMLLQSKLSTVDPQVLFRIDGPDTGRDNLFIWDTGYGPQSQGNNIILTLDISLASDPLQLAEVENIATPTAATPTTEEPASDAPTDESAQVLPESTEAGLGTPASDQIDELATATPVPVIDVSTPTEDPVFALATALAQQTPQADTTETSVSAVETPSATETPVPTVPNQATVQAVAIIATAQAFDPSQTASANTDQTATSPWYTLLESIFINPISTPPIETDVLPEELIGKIAFKSNRLGQEAILIMNPDGSELALLHEASFYENARSADIFSADGRFMALTKDTARTDAESGRTFNAPTVYAYDFQESTERQVTTFEIGAAYGPVWSPSGERVAFVSDASGNDEIWVANRDGSDLRQLTRNERAWDRSPTWSPDGQQIAFWSNRGSIAQIWVMDADGSNLRVLTDAISSSLEPVWFKYSERPQYRRP